MNRKLRLIVFVFAIYLGLAGSCLAFTKNYYFNYQIDAKSVDMVRTDIDALIDSGATKINFWIDSPGGYVTSSFALYDYLILVRKRGVVVDTYATGLCASGATIVMQAGETRHIGAFTMFMIHRSQIHTGNKWRDKYYAWKYRKHSTYVDNHIIDLYVCRTHLPRKTLEKMMTGDCWMYAIEAKELRFVDKIFIGL